MKQYLEIKSSGEIDIQAFTLIGASTKKGDNIKNFGVRDNPLYANVSH